MSVGTSASTDWKDTTGGGGGGSVPSGTGFTHITGGSQDAAAVTPDLGTSHVTGTLAAARFPALTGDVTTTAGSVATTIANGSVTLAKQANLAANSIQGNNTGSAGVPLALTAAQTKSLLAITSSDVSGLGALATQSSVTVAQEPARSGGDVTNSAGSGVLTILAQSVSYAKMQNVSATSRVMGRITAGAGSMEELTGTQVTTLLDAFTTTLKGLTPASGGGTANFLRADGTWAQPSGTVTVATLTPGATVATDCSTGNVFRLAANQNFTLSNPTNGVDGTRYTWEIAQDSTGSRIMTLGTNFVFGTDITGADLSTTASTTDVLSAVFHSPSGKFRIVGFVRGF